MSLNLAYFMEQLNEDLAKFCDHELGERGLTQGQLSFLIYIGDHPNCSPSELAHETKADSGYTTRSVKRLVSGGFAVKERHADDGRAYVLRLTEAGMDSMLAAKAMYLRWEDRVLSDLDAGERELLRRMLGKMGF